MVVVARCETVHLGFEPIIFESLGDLEQGVRDLLANLYDQIDECHRHETESIGSSSFQECLDHLNLNPSYSRAREGSKKEGMRS